VAWEEQEVAWEEQEEAKGRRRRVCNRWFLLHERYPDDETAAFSQHWRREESELIRPTVRS
jgi:hypothetical protein